MEANAALVALLIAKDAIRDTVYRYCRGIDRLDLDLVRSCYHPDATDQHGSFSGTVDEYLAWVEPLLGKYDRTFHFVGNVVIDFAPPTWGAPQPISTDLKTAWCESYGVAHHEAAGGADHQNLVTGFRFLDRFEDRGAGWAIASRVATTEWSRVDPEAGWWQPPAEFTRGSRDTTDPLYNQG